MTQKASVRDGIASLLVSPEIRIRDAMVRINANGKGIVLAVAPDRPLLEDIIERVRAAGIRHVHLTTHYKPEVIRSHFGDGHDFGVDISYTDEVQPLGTAGALSKLPEGNDRLLVINGDILTRLNF